MAIVRIVTGGGNLKGTVRFDFTTDHAPTYLSANGASLNVKITLLDPSGKRIGKVSSSGMGAYAVYRWNQEGGYPIPGVIVDNRAYEYSAAGPWLGQVNFDFIENTSLNAIAQVSVDWTPDDDAFLTRYIQALPPDVDRFPKGAPPLRERFLQGAVKRAGEVAGCTALILLHL